MKSWLFAILACFGLATASPAVAASEKPLFAANDPIHIAIQAPLWSLINNRSSRGVIQGTLTDPNGLNLPVALNLRGITRRTSEVCDFPPLRVSFPAPPPPTSLFAGQKRLRLITHCKNTGSFRQYVLLEYSAYRMYNLLTPHSFRTRLATIDYRDAAGRPIASQVGFFLEDLGDVAHRNGMKVAHGGERIPTNFLSSPDAARYALFQHMLGNHDWSMRAGPAGRECCHNAELIGVLAPGATIPVPYDFDFSGFVDPPYATPPAEIDITDVRQRFYRGYCMHNNDVIAVARQMRASQPQILGVLSQVPGLEPRTQQRAGNYLQGFFNEIGNDATFNSRILNHCIRG
jgi:hypothetical protein